MYRILSLIGILLIFSTAPSWAAESYVNRILVKINDNIITEFDLDEEMKPILEKVKGRTLTDRDKAQLAKLRKQTVEKLVNDILIGQEIARYGINVSEEMIDREIARVKHERDMDDAAFEEMIANDGFTMEEFRGRLEKLMQKQELIGHMVNNKVLVTDSEIQKEYEARQDDYTLEKMVELGVLLLPPDISAVEVRERIRSGEMNFVQAVEKYSIGPGKNSGGSIGEVAYADLAEDWREAINGLKQGGVSEPLTIQGREALLSPLVISENKLVPLEDVRDDIYEELLQTKRDTIFKEYFDKLKQSSVIIYMDKSLEPDNGVS